MSVYIINLLALLGENKDIVDFVKSSFRVNFDQTMMGFYFDSFVSGVIPISLE
jgi:hypothetical protein